MFVLNLSRATYLSLVFRYFARPATAFFHTLAPNRKTFFFLRAIRMKTFAKRVLCEEDFLRNGFFYETDFCETGFLQKDFLARRIFGQRVFYEITFYRRNRMSICA